MTTKRVDLKDFLRAFVNTLPKDRGREKPLICLEFKDRHENRYFSRIVIYRIESLRVVWYKFADRGGSHIRDWPVDSGDWKVANIVPPPLGCRHLNYDESKFGDSLAIIQVEHFNG